MAKQNNDLDFLKEQSLWIDAKGRTLLVYRRWFQSGPRGSEVGDIDLIILDTLELTRRPYSEIQGLIIDGRMKFARELVDIRESLLA
ncbi:hypothetical protein [Dyadobacter sp.]|uniref:hypothetical protein n=1 Tax=Dyadobacter sp. TaxID=1914288 RepID=UPI003F6EB9F0